MKPTSFAMEVMASHIASCDIIFSHHECDERMNPHGAMKQTKGQQTGKDYLMCIM
jgi:hypothetical protein